MSATNPSEAPQGSPQTQDSPQTLGGLYEIAGQKFTEDDIKKALGGLEEVEAAKREAQADYTRKTQDISRKRREVEEMEAKAKSLLEKAEQQLGMTSEADPAFESALQPLRREVQQLAEIVKEDRQTRLQREESATLQENRRAALRSLKGRPFINEETITELESFMERNNLGPEQVNLAYNATFAAQIGELRGRQRAIVEGAASGPPLVGSGATRISPGFTTPTEAPGTEFSVEKMSWDSVKTAAMNSPDKPTF